MLLPEDERRKNIRRSTGIFIQPDDEAIIQPLDGSDTFTPINAYDYLMGVYYGTHSNPNENKSF